MSEVVTVLARAADGAAWTGAAAAGPEPHRLLWGDGPEGPWCGAGPAEGDPVLATSWHRVAIGRRPAHELAGSRRTAPPGDGAAAAEAVAAAALDDGGGIAAALLSELECRLGSGAGPGGSVLLAVQRGDGAVEAWLGLGPPAAAVPVRCWPGIPHLLDAGVGPADATPLAVAAQAVTGALADGRIERARLDEALARVRHASVLEGREAERQAGIMDAAGDDGGGAVRRIVAQAHACGLARAGLEALLAAAGDRGSAR